MRKTIFINGIVTRSTLVVVVVVVVVAALCSTSSSIGTYLVYSNFIYELYFSSSSDWYYQYYFTFIHELYCTSCSIRSGGSSVVLLQMWYHCTTSRGVSALATTVVHMHY